MAKHDPFVEDPYDDEENEELLEPIDGEEDEGEDEALGDDRPARARDARLIHGDAAIVVIDKPAGMSLIEDESGRAVLHDTERDADVDLTAALTAFAGASKGSTGRLPAGVESGNMPPVRVHPVDTDVSGLLILARGERVRDALRAQFADGRLILTHHAIVQAVMPVESGVMNDPIRIISEQSGRVRIDPTGRPARTEWRRLDTFVNYALLACVPRTVEPCQIRAHLAHAGMPLAVDRTHGGAQHLMLSSFKAGYRKSHRHRERPLIARVSLHAATLSLTHPDTGESLSFQAAPPRDFKAAVHQLERFGRIPKPQPHPRTRGGL